MSKIRAPVIYPFEEQIITRIKIRDKNTNQNTYHQYDYNALGNIPLYTEVIVCTRATLPFPGELERGKIALIQDFENRRTSPVICLRQGERYSWVAFGRPKIGLLSPAITFAKDRLEFTPTIKLTGLPLAAPEIWGVIDQLSTPSIELDIPKLFDPFIYLDTAKLGAPYVELIYDKLEAPNIGAIKSRLPAPLSGGYKGLLGKPEIEVEKSKLIRPIIRLEGTEDTKLHPAILGKAILGYCYLGGGSKLDTPTIYGEATGEDVSGTSAILGEAVLGNCQLGSAE